VVSSDEVRNCYPPKQYSESRNASGTVARTGSVGRRKGTGRNTFDNLEDGYVRALASTLSDYGLDRWMPE